MSRNTVIKAEIEEPIGSVSNGGRDWQPAGEPQRVDVHDVADRSVTPRPADRKWNKITEIE